MVTSRQLAENFGKAHGDVLESIRNLTKEISIVNLTDYFIEDVYINERGREYPQYLLTKDEFNLYMFNIQGYIEYKIAYIQAFNRMEAELISIKDSYLISNPIERAKAWIKEQEQTMLLQQKVHALTPKAEFYDNIVAGGDTFDISEVAKMYKIRRTDGKKGYMGSGLLFK